VTPFVELENQLPRTTVALLRHHHEIEDLKKTTTEQQSLYWKALNEAIDRMNSKL
jgi:hypothetical protein